MSYLDTAAEFYASVAQTPDEGLCCVNQEPLSLPDLVVPEMMQRMNYGCGTTVQVQELTHGSTVLYVGVGGGLEALQFAYFSQRPGAVIAVDPVSEMREVAAKNLVEAATLNPWFDPAFVQILSGDAFALPLPDHSVDVVAQNCLFNIFEPQDLAQALAEANRVLRPLGRLLMSDPIATRPIPEHLRQDERLRAMCLSGALTEGDYLQQLAKAGFGEIEIRSRRPYRVLDRTTYHLEADIALDSLDSVAIKTPVPCGGPNIKDFSSEQSISTLASKCCG